MYSTGSLVQYSRTRTYTYACTRAAYKLCSCAMEDDATLSHRAEVFRSKLIEDFQILECTSEEGRRKAPVYTSADFISKHTSCLHNPTIHTHMHAEPGILDKVLLNTPEQLVKFKAYIRDEKDDEADMVDRRLTRIKNQNRLPLGVWAKMVTESILSTCTIVIV